MVRQERCARVRNRNVACMKCAEACTSGCISYTGEELCIDATLCVGCGTCATVCPTCALEARNPDDAQLENACVAAVRDGEVVIACKPLLEALEGKFSAEAVVSVVCAGRVEESLVLSLAAQGIATTIACGNCGQCAQEHGLATAQMVTESANSLLASWDKPAMCHVAHTLPERVLTCSGEEAQAASETYFAEKRGNAPIIGDVAAGGVSVAADSAEDASQNATSVLKVMKDGTLPHFVPDRRERLLTALSRLGEPRADNVESRLWGCVVINGMKCVSCQMCATFCPTGAIAKFAEEDGTFGVIHYPGDCVKCGSCRDICPADAILLLDEVKPNYILDGAAHRYVMKPRAVTLNDPHQILHTMQERMKGNDLFER